MRISRKIGWLLLVSGIGIAFLSPWIVFPGLERLLGIETLVGKQNVVYLDSSGYAYTNPGAMTRWIFRVAAVGLIVCLLGALKLIESHKAKS